MKEINIIQFTPYFPPHKGGLETVAEEIGEHWIKQKYGRFINVTFSVGQQEGIFEYEKDGCKILVIPAFDIVPNFPIPKIWDKRFWEVFKKLREMTSPQPSPQGEGVEKQFPLSCKERGLGGEVRIITHTRFFLSSFIGGLFAIKNKIKWFHLEHGSGYVKLSSKFKSKVAYIYDRLIGKWIFKSAYKILVISGACRKFVHEEFLDREVEVFYRGLDFPKASKEKKGDIKIVFVGRLVGLKGVAHLIEVYKKLGIQNELIIIGDGEEKEDLEKQALGQKGISFLGFQNRDFVLDYLKQYNCIFVNPSYQEGMPTSVMEALFYKNVVVASDVGGTSEISDENDLILIEPGNEDQLRNSIKIALEQYEALAGKSKTIITQRFSRDRNITRLYELIK